VLTLYDMDELDDAPTDPDTARNSLWRGHAGVYDG